MREVIAICRSSKRSRIRVASVLDRYFWRIGDRTWRGRASNACLDRVARELRGEAKRNTAVAIHEIRSARESRVPIVRIGSRAAFSPDGLAPVASHPARASRWPPRPDYERHALAIVTIAVLFHDLGKATKLFQAKLRRGLKKNAKPEADAVRHELVSAVVWDRLVGALDDHEAIAHLRTLAPRDIDAAWVEECKRLKEMHQKPSGPMDLAFEERPGTIAHAVGMLVLTHHRLPEAASDHLTLESGRHVRSDAELTDDDLTVAKGMPHWHDDRWISRLRRATDDLKEGKGVPMLDMALRASLMFADHLGSALKEAHGEVGAKVDGHLGNTLDGRPADPLDIHVHRVLQRVPGAFDMLHRHRERYPALDHDQVPLDLLHPEPTQGSFAWQSNVAQAARELAGSAEGGFFACLLAGTGTGKTRGAPTVLTAAAFADAVPERRYLRMTLGLGLRSLATQSAEEYVSDLDFSPDDVSVLIGQPPVRFDNDADDGADGSESLVALPDWLRVVHATGGVPPEGSEREEDWLRTLSHDSDRGLPATLDLAIEKSGGRGVAARRLISSPILVGTVDHLMGVASPTSARYLFQAVRAMTADLILDEIDQYDPEDIAAIARLVYQTAASGRRVVVMSATLTKDVACALHEAYREGWHAHAVASGAEEHVHVLVTGDAIGSCETSMDGMAFEAVYEAVRKATLAGLDRTPVRRVGRVLPPCDDWTALVDQIDGTCSELHDATTAMIDGLAISIGFVRMTRIAHATALATQLPAGPRNGRLRLKLCLHSQFPRLHRAWIERELKRALTRKGAAPDIGLRLLCERHGVLAQAQAEGCRAIELVVVTSPVIETGSDLDFDWAVIDPSSTRAIVQAAGRVWRHRTYHENAPNVAILGQAAVVMQTGKLARPGVETKPHEDTLVSRVTLDAFGERHLMNLADRETFERIDAGIVLRTSNMPLRGKEAELRGAMLKTHNGAPLDRYLRHPSARLNLRFTRSRRFRRDTARDLLYFLDSEQWEDAEWRIDLAPGTRESDPRSAAECGLTLACKDEPHLIVPDLAKAAWSDYSRGDETTTGEIQRLSQVMIPDYGSDAEPVMTYCEWTGFTRGTTKDLYEPFGKSIG